MSQTKRFQFSVPRREPAAVIPQPEEIQKTYAEFMAAFAKGKVSKLFLSGDAQIPTDYALVSDGVGLVTHMPEIPGVAIRVLPTGDVIITVDADPTKAPYQVIGVELTVDIEL